MAYPVHESAGGHWDGDRVFNVGLEGHQPCRGALGRKCVASPINYCARAKIGFDPSNRRISLIVQYLDKDDAQQGITAESVKKMQESEKHKTTSLSYDVGAALHHVDLRPIAR